MEADAAKLIGAGLAAIGMIGAGIGVGNVWASYISAIARNPASKDEIGANIWIGFAVTEAIALFALIVALIALFAEERLAFGTGRKWPPGRLRAAMPMGAAGWETLARDHRLKAFRAEPRYASV